MVTWIDQVWWSCDQGWNRIFFQMMNLGKQLRSNSGHEGGKSVQHLRQMLLVMTVGVCSRSGLGIAGCSWVEEVMTEEMKGSTSTRAHLGLGMSLSTSAAWKGGTEHSHIVMDNHD